MAEQEENEQFFVNAKNYNYHDDNNQHDTLEEFECMDGKWLARSGCILSYNGSIKDILLNYLVLLINLGYCVAAIVIITAKKSKLFQTFALGAFLFVVLFQLSLCLVLGCSGVSIIWCAMGGWTMSERRKVVDLSFSLDPPPQQQSQASFSLEQQGKLLNFGKVVILLDAAVIAYYAVVTEPITSVAHVCALILGAVLSRMSDRLLVVGDEGEEEEEEISRNDHQQQSLLLESSSSSIIITPRR